jgi:DNA-binding MarR family transcriptional regulator
LVAQHGADDHIGLPYQSQQLAALLEVFSVWSSGTFIRTLASGAGVDLDATSIAAMTLLARDGEQRASVLASRLRVGASAISKLSNRLGARNLVEKRPDPSDSRATLLALSVAGEALVQALVDAGDVMMSDLLRDWRKEDRDDFNRLLRRFRDEAISYADRIDTTGPPSPPTNEGKQ